MEQEMRKYLEPIREPRGGSFGWICEVLVGVENRLLERGLELLVRSWRHH